MSTRHQGLDAVRAFACIMVVAIHAAAPSALTGPASPGWITANILDGAGRWAVPVFFMLTGWACLTQHAPKISAFARLLTALLFYTSIALILRWVSSGAFPGWDFLWKEPAYYHLWYFYVALAVYAILAVVQLRPDTPKWALWAILLGPLLVNPHMGFLFSQGPTGNLFELSGGMGAYFLYALAAGALVRLRSWSNGTGAITGSAMLLIGVAWSIWMTHTTSVQTGAFVQTFYAYGSIGPMLAAYGVFLLGLSCPTLPSLLVRVTAFIATRSLVVYGLHPFVLEIIDRVKPLPDMSGSVIIATWIATIAISLLLAHVVMRFDTKKWVS